MSAKPSSGGKYLAVTVNIVATSQDQIDAIYSDLTGSQQVLMAL
jgi:putative lipoic acid-binding regulatory protein